MALRPGLGGRRIVKRIIFNLKREWYDKIASGEKTVEYRKLSRYWRCRLVFGPYLMNKNGEFLVPDGDVFAVFRLGYSRTHPDIVRRIVKIDIGPCPYDGWNGEYFRIHFGKEEGK